MKISARFLKILRLGCEYPRTATRYRQSENGIAHALRSFPNSEKWNRSLDPPKINFFGYSYSGQCSLTNLGQLPLKSPISHVPAG